MTQTDTSRSNALGRSYCIGCSARAIDVGVYVHFDATFAGRPTKLRTVWPNMVTRSLARLRVGGVGERRQETRCGGRGFASHRYCPRRLKREREKDGGKGDRHDGQRGSPSYSDHRSPRHGACCRPPLCAAKKVTTLGSAPLRGSSPSPLLAIDLVAVSLFSAALIWRLPAEDAHNEDRTAEARWRPDLASRRRIKLHGLPRSRRRRGRGRRRRTGGEGKAGRGDGEAGLGLLVGCA
jgi:hypothetical protein